jgi:class 3 adenylate cyclase
MKLVEDWKLALDADWKFNLGSYEKEKWAIEYRRIGRKYASWGAIFAIFGIPSILLSEMHNTYENPQLWLFYRMLPSVVIGIAFILFKLFKYSHEILFLVIGYSLFLCFSYWPDCNALDNFLYGQLTMFIPIAFITMLRPFYYVINFVVHLVLLSSFYSYYCQHDVITFFSTKEFVPILIASISAFMVASFRYFLAKRNFIFNILLHDALLEAEAGRKKSDELLRNILPEEIAEELKEKGNSAARGYDEVTILFTDFKNFTELSGKMSAIELVGEIDENFKELDAICENYHIEKIKTIGDAYMAASGLPVPTNDSVKNAVLAALKMQDHVKSRVILNNSLEKPAFEMRVGIHTGPVVAGIVGVKKFQYDIWGDTVNTASRMESSGEVGKVNISQTTYELLKNDPDFTFTSRGKIAAKGKGEIEMWFVERTM